MSILRVTFFGGFHAARDGFPIKNFHSQKAQLLLAYLMLYRQKSHPRAVLVDLLWGDSGEDDRTLASLRAALHSLRQLIEGPKARFGKYILTEGAAVRFNRDGVYSLDVEEFEKALASARSASGEARAALLRQAVELYQGDLLAGFYEDWVLIEQQHFRDLYLQALKELMTYHQECHEYDQAIRWARRALEANSLQEEIHQALIRLYALAGDRNAALQRYAECEALLKRELKLEPLPETRALYERILRGDICGFDREVSPSSATPVRHNLPRPLSSFIGRKKEIAEIKRLLASVGADPRVCSDASGEPIGSPLLTLMGPGGCGKTRLALQVAAELTQEYADGVWFVELATLSDATSVPQALVSALDVREETGCPLLTLLSNYLQSKQLLLVLDNCEHLVEGCVQLVEELLQYCPSLRIVATSREELGIAGETVWKTPPLLSPDLQSLPSKGEELVATLIQYEAVELFVERAASSDSGFRLTNQNARAIAEVCHRLDGIPLAIELAAARVKVLSLEEIAERLDNVLGLLTQGSRTALPKHQTLRAAMDWSFHLLPEPEQILLRRLSVFAGGFLLETVEAVCAQHETESGSSRTAPTEILDLMTQLVNKSLVHVTNQHGKVRYRLLEMVRQYAREKLEESGEATSLRQSHLDFFLRLAERAEPELKGADQTIWLGRLEAEHDNLRAVLRWSLQKGDIKAGLRLAGAVWWFWYVRGYLREGRKWLEEALAVKGGSGSLPARAKASNGAGVLAWSQGDYISARAFLEKSLAIGRELRDKQGIARLLNNLGLLAQSQGDYVAARSLYEECLVIKRELGDKQGITAPLNNLGIVAQNQGDYATARSLFEESLAIRQELGDKQGIGAALINLGYLAQNQGDYLTARSLFEKSLVVKRELGDKQGTATSLNNLALAIQSQGDYVTARSLFEESLAIRQELGDKQGIIASLSRLAGLSVVQTHPGRAARLFGAAEALREAIGAPLPPSDRTDYDRQVAATRAKLGDETFAAAWTQGRAMTLEQAVEYALKQ
ncbi:tetratricopeptide repeat protein [Candidatus Acetothermia bacterium]|nr:tetratricopeptide repeat protein [Candidatus Acetothermia bacterium]